MKADVLIVEDERLVARELQLRLEENGYRVTAKAATSDDALRAATVKVPDLVLMDIHLAGERDGIDTAAVLQQRFDVPVVFLTAHSDEATVERATEIGAAGYLIKPPKERELIVAIEVALHKHQMARQLRTREKWFSTTLRSIGDAVISTDSTGKIAFMNPVAEVLTGWRAEEARGQPASSVIRLVRNADGSSESPIDETIRRKQTIHIDGTLTDRAGRERAITDSASPIIDETGSLLGGVLVLRDITDQRALERQLEAAERLASLGTLAAGVAHEINNPLTWIIANLTHLSEVLAAGELPSDTGVLREEIAEALKGTERIQRIVRDLAVFSRRPTERDGCEVAQAIRQAIASTPTAIEITTEIDGVQSVAIDESRLVQVLTNLLANAIHAIEDAPPREHRIAIRATRAGDAVRIEVTDTGAGMLDMVRERAFEPFFTSKAMGRGTGLGLSISHGLVAAAGGSLDIADTSDRGTTLAILLPLARSPAPSVQPELVTTYGRILVIDDEETMRRLVKRVLRGHDVTAVEVADARRLLRDGQRYDVILCDLMMPDTSGMDFYEEVLALDPAQADRIVFVTGGAFNIRSTEFLASTNNLAVEKPFSPVELATLVSGLVAKRRAPGA